MKAVDSYGAESAWSYTNLVTIIQDRTSPSGTKYESTPNISNGAWANQNVAIKILGSTDSQSGVNRTEYKIGSAEYVTGIEFTVTSTNAVKIRAVDNVGNIEPDVNIQVNIDKIAPPRPSAVDMGDKAAHGNTATTVKVSGGSDTGGSGFKQYLYRHKDVETWSEMTGDSVLITKHGETLFASKDNAGNVSVAFELFVELDTIPSVPPNIQFTLPTPLNYGKDFNITWGASTSVSNTLAGYRLERRINSGEWVEIYRGAMTSYADNLTRDLATSVNYRVRGYSTSGLLSDYRESVAKAVVNNTSPSPTTWLSVPSSNVNSWSTPTLTWTWSESADIDGDAMSYYVEKSVNSGAWVQVQASASRTYTHTVSISGAKDTSVKLRVRVYDTRAYSAYTAENVVTITQDNTAPNSPIISLGGTLGENGWYTSDVIVTLTHGTDAESGVSHTNYSTDNTTPSIQGLSTVLSSSALIRAQTVDKHGNKSNEASRQVYIDKVVPNAPSYMVGGGKSVGVGVWNNANIELTFIAPANTTVSGLRGIEYSINNGVTWVSSYDLMLSDTKALKIRTVSNAGLRSPEVTIQVNIDKGKAGVEYSKVGG